MKYTVTFTGREVGAIGVIGRHTINLDFDKEPTPDEILSKLYETHEHITGVRGIPGINVQPESGEDFGFDLEGNVMRNGNSPRNRWLRYRADRIGYNFTYEPYERWLEISAPDSYSAEPQHSNYFVKEVAE